MAAQAIVAEPQTSVDEQASHHDVGLQVSGQLTLDQDSPSPCLFSYGPLSDIVLNTQAAILRPLAFFPSWSGVLTLAYTGWSPALAELKGEINARLPQLPKESPGSRWPKTSLGCLKEGQRLTPEQLQRLHNICLQESGIFQNLQSPKSQSILVDRLEVVLYECRCLERTMTRHGMSLQCPPDTTDASSEEQARVLTVVAEADAPDYWFHAARDGNREQHYRGPALGATLVHYLTAVSGGSQNTSIKQQGREPNEFGGALASIIEAFRKRVDQGLPGLYSWFSDESLHSKKDLKIKYQVLQQGQQPAGGKPRQKVLITAGCGLLGRHIVELLVKKFNEEFEVVVLDIAASTFNRKWKQVTYVAGDVRVPTHIQAVLSGVSAVIHTAGLLQGASTDMELMQAIELDGTRNLLETCLEKDIKAFIYTSSVFVHWTKAGSSDGLRAITEDEPLPPESHIQLQHSAYKRAAERLVLAANGHVIRTVALRPGLLISKERSKDAFAWIVGGLLSQPLGSSNKHVPCCWVADAARAHVCALVKLTRPNDKAAITKASEFWDPATDNTDQELVQGLKSSPRVNEGNIAGQAFHVCYNPEEEQPTQRELLNLMLASTSHRTQLLYEIVTRLPTWATHALIQFNEGSASPVLSQQTDGTREAVSSHRRASSSNFNTSNVRVHIEPQSQEELTVALIPSDTKGHMQSKIQFAYNVSWIVNMLLFLCKGYAWWISQSKSVLASLVDSMVDLASQVVIFVAEYQSKKADPQFPVGKARLETLGVLACACIMSVSAYAVIQDSGTALYEGLAKGLLPELDAGIVMYAVLGAATALKIICYAQCIALQKESDSMMALAEDHLNDIVSNVGAAVTSAIGAYVASAWWADPAGGILISLFILWRWYEIARTQIEKIVGRSAPDEVLEELRAVAADHHHDMELDILRAYHYGSRFLVEAEVVMPMSYTLKEVHDISLDLQHKLEAMAEVERAFVHVDYAKRDEPEHRTDRLLAGLPVVAEDVLLSPARAAGSNLWRTNSRNGTAGGNHHSQFENNVSHAHTSPPDVIYTVQSTVQTGAAETVPQNSDVGNDAMV